MRDSSRERIYTIAWAAASAALMVLWFMSESWGSDPGPNVAFVCVPLAGIALGALKWPLAAMRVGTGLSLGAAIGFVGVLTLGLPLLLVGVGMGGDIRTIPTAIGMLIVQCVYLRLALRSPALRESMNQSPFTAVLGLLLLPVMVVGPSKLHAARRATLVADGKFWGLEVRDLLTETTLCVLQSRDSTGQFPAAFPGHCSRRTPTASALGVEIEYDTMGDSLVPRANFTLYAISRRGGTGDVFWADTTAVLRHNPPSHPITEDSEIHDTPLLTLRSLRNCANVRKGMTAAMAIGLTSPGPLPDACRWIDYSGDTMSASPDGTFTSSRGYQYAIHWIDTASALAEVHARPRDYGRTGIRSYLLDVTDTVRSTAEDRPATSSDRAFPLIPGAADSRTPR
ncbi:MAG TPA: hypothetical protein VFO55_13060 [Gemmatimonadaceae bacterium]|nr:hypothetical protein [Gemmatimonadaceae bacterium]